MTSRISDRLAAGRRKHFVGRQSEVALFRSAITADHFPFHILYILGPGGVGKSSLLDRFVTIATAEAGLQAGSLDARNVEPTPVAFNNALRALLQLPIDTSPVDALAQLHTRFILCIDTYESLETLEEWLLEEFIPELPANVMMVFAGRNHPPHQWRSDSGWQELVRIIPLRNLLTEESCEYLTGRNIPHDQQQAVLDFTFGHPLALSLVADLFAYHGNIHFTPELQPDIVKMLLERFLQRVPGPAHRAALEACALVRVTTEALLQEMVGPSGSHELFNWLRSLSFVESAVDGLFPHDLTREALVADLRWRNPDWYIELHRRARSYYAGRLQRAQSHDQQRILFDYTYLHRDNPVMRQMFMWQGVGNALADLPRQSDFPLLLQMVERHEGEESAAIAAFWFQQQPLNVLVLRTPQGTPVGFLMMLALEQTSEEDRQQDPATIACWQYLQQYAPLRTGERATLFRFWMAADGYQELSPVQSSAFINVGRYYLTTPNLAFTFFPCAHPDFWTQGFSYIDLQRLPEADYRVGEHHVGVYGHDWRIVPPMQWLAVLAERETAAANVAGKGGAPTPVIPQVIVLSKDAFDNAILSALKNFTSPDRLLGNPLLRSRLVMESERLTNTTPPVEVLQQTIQTAVEQLKTNPKEEKLYRAVYRTYLNPASSQERAAELLDLPFSTYRRHLKSGLDRVQELLWWRELAGGRSLRN